MDMIESDDEMLIYVQSRAEIVRVMSDKMGELILGGIITYVLVSSVRRHRSSCAGVFCDLTAMNTSIFADAT